MKEKIASMMHSVDKKIVSRWIWAFFLFFTVFYLSDLFLGWLAMFVITHAPSMTGISGDVFNIVSGIFQTMVLLASIGLALWAFLAMMTPEK
jgi:hypothetical protein